MVETLPWFALVHLQEIPPWVEHASEWYGAYNTVLLHVFSPNDGYLVSPEYYDPPGQINPAPKSGIFHFRMKYSRLPFLFIKVMPRPFIETQSERAAADRSLRMIMEDVVDLSLVPIVYGLSFLGTLFSIYQYNRGTKELLPPEILGNDTHVTDTAPREMWKYDLLTPAGENKFMEIVALAKSMAESLDSTTVSAKVAEIRARNRERDGLVRAYLEERERAERGELV